MIEFDEPLQTKSGGDITRAWRDLQKFKDAYSRAVSGRDDAGARAAALQVRRLQEDIGLKPSAFAELDG